MKKKTNIFKRNSGFLAGCVLTAAVSFFAVDTAMTNGLMLTSPGTEPEEQETASELAPETSESRVYETDAFTVTASGNIIKGVETEAPTETDENWETVETDEQGNPISSDGTSGDTGTDGGSGDGGYTDNGSYSGGGGYTDNGSSGDGGYTDDGSYSGSDGYTDGGSGGQTIEITDPGNGDYTYDDGSSGSSGEESAYTPDDVIIQGISSRYIDESELYNYDAGQLRLIRNEIFALNGRIFNSQDLRDYFSQKSWYVPQYSPEEFDANMFYYLNDYEEANLNVILNYEAALAGN